MDNNCRSHWEDQLGQCDSPIESIFLEKFCIQVVGAGYKVGRFTSDSETIAVKPQENIIPYRIDFAIGFDFFDNILLIAVECDGHDWHDLTKDQAIRDRQRDRFLQSIGYRILRFTGTELNVHPTLCAIEVLDQIMTFQTGCILRGIEKANGLVL